MPYKGTQQFSTAQVPELNRVGYYHWQFAQADGNRPNGL